MKDGKGGFHREGEAGGALLGGPIGMKGNVVKGAIFLVSLVAFIWVAWQIFGWISGHSSRMFYNSAGEALSRTFG